MMLDTAERELTCERLTDDAMSTSLEVALVLARSRFMQAWNIEKWNPAFGVCHPLSEMIRDACQNQSGLTADIVGLEMGQEDTHFFVMAWQHETPDERWLIDGTYQQFVPRDRRTNLPVHLIAKLTNQHELAATLTSFGIPAERQHLWICPLFDPSRR